MQVEVQYHRDSTLMRNWRKRNPDGLLPGDAHGQFNNSGLYNLGAASRGRYRSRVSWYSAR